MTITLLDRVRHQSSDTADKIHHNVMMRKPLASVERAMNHVGNSLRGDSDHAGVRALAILSKAWYGIREADGGKW